MLPQSYMEYVACLSYNLLIFFEHLRGFKFPKIEVKPLNARHCLFFFFCKDMRLKNLILIQYSQVKAMLCKKNLMAGYCFILLFCNYM